MTAPARGHAAEPDRTEPGVRWGRTTGGGDGGGGGGRRDAPLSRRAPPRLLPRVGGGRGVRSCLCPFGGIACDIFGVFLFVYFFSIFFLGEEGIHEGLFPVARNYLGHARPQLGVGEGVSWAHGVRPAGAGKEPRPDPVSARRLAGARSAVQYARGSSCLVQGQRSWNCHLGTCELAVLGYLAMCRLFGEHRVGALQKYVTRSTKYVRQLPKLKVEQSVRGR